MQFGAWSCLDCMRSLHWFLWQTSRPFKKKKKKSVWTVRRWQPSCLLLRCDSNAIKGAGVMRCWWGRVLPISGSDRGKVAEGAPAGGADRRRPIINNNQWNRSEAGEGDVSSHLPPAVETPDGHVSNMHHHEKGQIRRRCSNRKVSRTDTDWNCTNLPPELDNCLCVPFMTDNRGPLKAQLYSADIICRNWFYFYFTNLSQINNCHSYLSILLLSSSSS